MSDAYDPAAFPPVAVTVDLVLMTIAEGRLVALLQQRDAAPFLGGWALPGGFVAPGETLEATAQRVLAQKAGLHDAYLEQLYTFGAPDRDPRMRIVTVAYFALLPADRFAEVLAKRQDLTLAPIGEAECGEGVALAFDHAQILAHARDRLRGKLDYSRIAFALLPDLFTLRDLQGVHEAILGRPLNKPAFRRRILDRGWIEGTGSRETGKTYRPAELYRVVE